MTVDILRLRLPLLGVIPAGWLSPAEEELGDTLTFEEWLVPHKEASCLVTVATNTLRSEGILPEDIVIMERGKTPRHGNIVIAEINGSPLIRRYERVGGVAKLVGDGAEISLGDQTEIRILGVATAVIRKYR